MKIYTKVRAVKFRMPNLPLDEIEVELVEPGCDATLASRIVLHVKQKSPRVGDDVVIDFDFTGGGRNP